MRVMHAIYALYIVDTRNGKAPHLIYIYSFSHIFHILNRDAEKQFRCANTQQPMVETALWLGKLFIRLDQPLAALELYR